MYGPEPTGTVLLFEALNGFGLSWAPAFWARKMSSAGSGCLRVICSVEGSTALASATLTRSDLLGEVPSRKRRMFCAATGASNGVPSVNFTSVRSFIVSTVLLALYDQLVASHGTAFASGVACSSDSYTAWLYGASLAQLALAAAAVGSGRIA